MGNSSSPRRYLARENSPSAVPLPSALKFARTRTRFPQVLKVQISDQRPCFSFLLAVKTTFSFTNMTLVLTSLAVLQDAGLFKCATVAANSQDWTARAGDRLVYEFPGSTCSISSSCRSRDLAATGSENVPVEATTRRLPSAAATNLNAPHCPFHACSLSRHLAPAECYFPMNCLYPSVAVLVLTRINSGPGDRTRHDGRGPKHPALP